MSDAEDWVDEGSDDELSRLPTVPVYVEVEPGVHKSSDDCSADELAVAGASRLMQARALMDESARLLGLAQRKRGQEGERQPWGRGEAPS